MTKAIKGICRIFNRKGNSPFEKGFTLIEMLVVTAILAAIATVVILNVTDFIGSGHQEASDTELHNVQTAVVVYATSHNGTIPENTDALVTAGYLVSDPHGTYTINQTSGEVTQEAYP